MAKSICFFASVSALPMRLGRRPKIARRNRIAGIAAQASAMSLSSMRAGLRGMAQGCEGRALRQRSARLARFLDPLEDLRAAPQHPEDEQRAQRRRDAENKVSQFRLHAGARTTQLPRRILAWMELLRFGEERGPSLLLPLPALAGRGG